MLHLTVPIPKPSSKISSTVPLALNDIPLRDKTKERHDQDGRHFGVKRGVNCGENIYGMVGDYVAKTADAEVLWWGAGDAC